MLGVAVGSIVSWIDQGLIRSGKTPGGHRRVDAEDLKKFLRRQNLPLPVELAPRKAIRVLVADREEAVANRLAEDIRRQHSGREVRTACGGFYAGEIVGSWRPDVLVLDLNLPGTDGYEVCRYVTSRGETRPIAVIGMTGKPAPKALARLRECGGRSLLSKPVGRDALLRELAAALEDGD